MNSTDTWEGAMDQADEIMRIWRAQGYTGLKLEIFRMIVKNRKAVWCIRSNMVNGRPPS
jgi:hypothetical protein